MSDTTPPTLGARAADWVAANIGRWAFVISMTGLVVVWMATNGIGTDPAPWQGLNLALGLVAAFTGPILLIASNRADVSRQRMLAMVEDHAESLERQTALWERHAEETHALMREVHALTRRMVVHLQIEVN